MHLYMRIIRKNFHNELFFCMCICVFVYTLRERGKGRGGNWQQIRDRFIIIVAYWNFVNWWLQICRTIESNDRLLVQTYLSLLVWLWFMVVFFFCSKHQIGRSGICWVRELISTHNQEEGLRDNPTLWRVRWLKSWILGVIKKAI